MKNKMVSVKTMTIKDFINSNYCQDQSSKIRLNNKPIHCRKLKNILLNNYSQDTEIKIEYKLQIQPFYKGDYLYFADNYGHKGLNRLKNERVYLEILEERTL